MKELIVKPTVAAAAMDGFLDELLSKNLRLIYADPHLVGKRGLKTISESEDADMIVCEDLEKLKLFRRAGKTAGYSKKVLSNHDVDEIERASTLGAQFVIVDASDWKIIPLENIIAKLHKSDTKVFTTAKTVSEVSTMFSVLEMGVDGVIFSTDNADEVERVKEQLSSSLISLAPARIIEVKDVGTGERVCVDTASMMEMGEGMLVGSRSNFMLLVHNESIGSSFTSPRPFRVNAGAVYCYTITPDGKTKYLSEIESGSEVWIVNQKGVSRKVVVGRAKIETRPLKLLRAVINGESGTVILQNAETIRLVRTDGSLISVTQIKEGDEVLGYVKPVSGRHFGLEVNEYIVEK